MKSKEEKGDKRANLANAASRIPLAGIWRKRNIFQDCCIKSISVEPESNQRPMDLCYSNQLQSTALPTELSTDVLFKIMKVQASLIIGSLNKTETT
ncbi:hypothetical protein CEXT_23231 [Caerostris extrusa]|uniref:Uncharacterized protein n=1 Tax=Caerostris extrusa TaxID=172846 RepID=A0AAV4XV02_CAEEX|nr:hypothetical protein CEXT_23231 [Caerostris extrusa]